jgi:hypothetical protein
VLLQERGEEPPVVLVRELDQLADGVLADALREVLRPARVARQVEHATQGRALDRDLVDLAGGHDPSLCQLLDTCRRIKVRHGLRVGQVEAVPEVVEERVGSRRCAACHRAAEPTLEVSRDQHDGSGGEHGRLMRVASRGSGATLRLALGQVVRTALERRPL